jgi:hypothetical protein
MDGNATIFFAIICLGRTGSTMLVDLLTSHPEIECKGELFNPVKGELRDVPIASRMTRLSGSAFDTQRPVRGFKMPFDWILMHPGIFDELRHIGYSMIWMHRQNALDHFLSMKLAALNSTWKSDRLYKIQSLSLDPWEFVRFIGYRDVATSLISSFASGMRHITVYYEDLARPQTHESLLSFLGTSPAELTTTATMRARTKGPHEIIENYDEMASFFRDSPYADYFRPDDGQRPAI